MKIICISIDFETETLSSSLFKDSDCKFLYIFFDQHQPTGKRRDGKTETTSLFSIKVFNRVSIIWKKLFFTQSIELKNKLKQKQYFFFFSMTRRSMCYHSVIIYTKNEIIFLIPLKKSFSFHFHYYIEVEVYRKSLFCLPHCDFISLYKPLCLLFALLMSNFLCLSLLLLSSTFHSFQFQFQFNFYIVFDINFKKSLKSLKNQLITYQRL